MTEGIVVLPVTSASIEACVDLHELAYERSGYKSKPFDRAHVRKGIEFQLRVGHSIVLMVYRESDMQTPLGFVRARIERVMFYDAPAIGGCTFYVDPKRNARGAAIALIEEFESRARDSNVEYVDVQITAGIMVAHTVALLGKMGYTALGGNFRKELGEGTRWVAQHSQ